MNEQKAAEHGTTTEQSCRRLQRSGMSLAARLLLAPLSNRPALLTRW